MISPSCCPPRPHERQRPDPPSRSRPPTPTPRPGTRPFFAASDGSEAGLAAFDQVSQRSAKYDASDTQRRWEHFHQSPPHRLGPGTLIYEARQIDPAFRLRSRQDRRPGGNSGPPNAGAADQDAAGPDEQACEWRPRLLRNDKGSARDCVANAALIVRSDARFIGRLRLDELYQATFTRDLPWDRSSTWRPWSDVDDIELAHWCQLRGVILKPPTCAAAIQMVSSHHRHHAVRGYLENLCWDSTPRLDLWLETYLGARIDVETLDAGVSDDDLNCEEPTPSERYAAYLRSVGSKRLIAVVARIYRPGCKADYVIIFEGPQGIGKSTCFLILAGDEWFADEIADLGTKNSAQDLRGKWIVELAEVAALRRAEMSA